MRRTLPGIFSFEYELPTPYNVSETPKSLDLENELPSVLQFEIGPSDIGGTLSVQLQLDHSRVSEVKIDIALGRVPGGGQTSPPPQYSNLALQTHESLHKNYINYLKCNNVYFHIGYVISSVLNLKPFQQAYFPFNCVCTLHLK